MKSQDWPYILLLLIVTLGLFGRAVSFEFVDWDDKQRVAENPDLQRGHFRDALSYWGKGHMDLYVPVSYTAYGLIAAVSHMLEPSREDLDPHLFHAANVVVHAIAVIVVFYLVKRAFGDRRAGAVGALIFAVHPLVVEPVAWIGSFITVLAGMFALGALLAASIGWYVLGSVLFVLAMLSKPSAVIVPLLAMVWCRMILKQSWRSVLKLAVPWLPLCVPIIIVGKVVQPARAVEPIAWWARPVVALDALAFYLGKIVAPVELCIDYGRTPQWLLGSWQAWVTWSASMVLFVIAWLLRRKFPYLLAGLLLIVAALLPVLGLWMFDFQGYSTVADRYAYIAMLGVAVIVAGLVRQYPRLLPVGAVVILALAARSAAQLPSWHDTFSLTASALAVNPQCWAGNKIRGFALARDARWEEAMPFYTKALEVRAEDVETRYNLANALLKLGRLDEAVAQYRAVESQWPADCRIRNNHGIALMQLQAQDEALEQFKTAVQVAPGDPNGYANLGVWHEKAGDFAEARRQYEMALRLDSSHQQAQAGLAQHLIALIVAGAFL